MIFADARPLVGHLFSLRRNSVLLIEEQRHHVYAATSRRHHDQYLDVRRGYFYQDGEAFKILALNKPR